MNPRAAFFIDGFNLYHSLAAFAKETGDDTVKWLDVVGLADGTLSAMQSSIQHSALPTAAPNR